MKRLVFDSSFPLVFFLINLVSFQSFLGSWLHFYNGPSKSKICRISAGVCSAAAEGGHEGLSRNATLRVGTCWNSLCPEGSWRIIILYVTLCFISWCLWMHLLNSIIVFSFFWSRAFHCAFVLLFHTSLHCWPLLLPLIQSPWASASRIASVAALQRMLAPRSSGRSRTVKL